MNPSNFASSHFQKLTTAVGILIQFLKGYALPVTAPRSVITLPNRLVVRALHATRFRGRCSITESYRLCIGAVPPTDPSLAQHLSVRESKGGQGGKDDRK